VASGSQDNTIKFWDVASGSELRTLSGHTNWIPSVAFSPDGKVLASGSFDRTIKFWDAASGSELRTLSGQTNSVPSVAFSPDGKVLASDSWGITLWDVASGRELRTLSGDVAFAFSPDGKVLASGSGDSVAFSPDGHMLAFRETIKLWDVASGSELRTLLFHLGEYPGLALAHEDVEVEVPHGGRF
jgi:WD40 repeat protein